MRRSTLLALVTKLGKEFVRRGMQEEARRLRLLYLALSHELVRGGREVEVLWNEELVVEWLKRLDVAPYHGAYPTRPRASGCERCAPYRGSLHTEAVFPGGAKLRCRSCGAVWLERGGPE